MLLDRLGPCQVQGKDPSLDVTQEIADEDEEDDPYSAAAADADADGDLVSSTTMTNVSHALTLPACELSRLPEITQLFTTMLSSAPIRCDRLATAIGLLLARLQKIQGFY